MKYNYIAIEGNIGSGKTSLSKLISEEFDAKLVLERFEDNSFLPKFYKDPDKYAFPLEMSFLADRFQQLKEELRTQELFSAFTIADYFIDKSLIFARQTLKDDEFNLYQRLFDIIRLSLPKPQLLVYLYNTPEQTLQNIIKRGRTYEQEIKLSYLEKIQGGYFNYFNRQKEMRIVIIDTRNLDFVKHEQDYRKIKTVLNKNFPLGIHRVSLL